MNNMEQIGNILKKIKVAPAPLAPDAVSSVVVTTNTIGISPKYVPLPREFLNFLLGALPGNTLRRDDLQMKVENGQEIYVWKFEGNRGDITIQMPKAFIDEKNAKGKYEKIPSLASIQTAYITAIKMAFEQCSETIEYTLGEKLVQMGYDRENLAGGGKMFHDLDRVERAMFGISIHWKGKGDNPVEKMRHPYAALDIIPGKGKGGKGTRYRATLTTISGIDFATGKVTPPFTKIPCNLTTSRSMSTYETQLRMKLHGLIGLPEANFKGETLLDCMGLPKSLRARKAAREKMLTIAQGILVDMGFTEKKIERNGPNVKKWLFFYTPPKYEKGKANPFDRINAGAAALIDEILEWHKQKHREGEQDQKLTDDQLRDQITNTIRVHCKDADGLDAVRNIFENVRYSKELYPVDFWSRIDTLKQRKAKKKSEIQGEFEL